MDTRLAKRNHNIQQWKTIIQDRNNTNLTVDEYCKQNGLSRHAYFYWLRIIREEVLEQSSESGFVELNLPAETFEREFSSSDYSCSNPKTRTITVDFIGVRNHNTGHRRYIAGTACQNDWGDNECSMTQPDSPIYTCVPDIPIFGMGLMDLLPS